MWEIVFVCFMIVVFVFYSLGMFFLGMRYRDKVQAEEKQLKIAFDKAKAKL